MNEHGGHQMSGPQWMWMPDLPPTLSNVLAWHPQPVPISLWVVVLGALLYAAALLAMHARGLSWPIERSIAFFAGIASCVVMVGTGINGYGMAMFSVHMIQHMVLSMASPLLLLLGRPVTLFLRALPSSSPWRKALLRFLHSRFVWVISAAWFTLPMFVLSLYGLYFTPLFDLLMNNWVGHEFMVLHFLAVGLTLYWPILALDPSPHRVPHALGFVLSLLPLPFHAFFAVTILDSNDLLARVFAHPPASWGVDPLEDQRVGAGLAWAFSELPGFAVTIIIAWLWWRSSQREAERHDRSEDRSGEAEANAYNAWLASLNRGD